MSSTSWPSARWQNRIIATLLILIALALLWLNQRNALRADVSANARHTLTQTTIDTLKNLDAPLAVTAVVGPGKQTRAAIEELINRAREYKPDVSLLFVNPETEPQKVRELNAAAGGQLIIEYQARERRLQNLSERSFTQALHFLSRSNTRTVAFVTGHGERSPDKETNDDYTYLSAELTQSGLQVIPLSLVTAPSVPDNIDVLVIAAPTQDFFPGEVASVLDFVGRGGNLLWLAESSDSHGLKALALELGVEFIPGIVIDVSSQAYGADSPGFTILDQFPSHPVNENLDSALLLPEALALNVTALAGQTTLPLMQTGAESWTETGPLKGAIKHNPEEGEQAGPLTLAITVERNKGKKTQRMAVVGDADFFASTWIGNGSNRSYAERLFNWLAADDELIGFETLQPKDTLVELTPRQTLILGAGFLLVLPFLLLLIGLLQWYRGRHG